MSPGLSSYRTVCEVHPADVKVTGANKTHTGGVVVHIIIINKQTVFAENNASENTNSRLLLATSLQS